MSNNHFGEANLGNSSAGSRKSKKISGSSSGGGSNSNSDKPKQPQRGLGVAQLEKIRLHGFSAASAYPQCPSSLHTPPNYPTTNFNNEEMRLMQSGGYCSIPSSSFSNYSSSSYSSPSYGFNSNIMMGLGEYERTNITSNGDSQHTTNLRWDANTNILDQNQHFAQLSSMSTGHLLNQDSVEQIRGKKHRSRSEEGSSSTQNSESSDNQEVDLELRLSL